MRAYLRSAFAAAGWLFAALLGLKLRAETERCTRCQTQQRDALGQIALAVERAKAAERALDLMRRRPTPPPSPPSSSGYKPIRTFKYKGEIASILQEERLKVGVEVGVFKGGFSRWMLSTWNACVSYYMVDLWAPQDHYRQMDAASLDENLQRMETARNNVAPWAKKATLIRNSSVSAAAQFADGSVDFVYLDARHTYDAVRADLAAWVRS